MSGIDEILAGYENLRPGQEDFHRDLHQHPELSHQEHQTTGAPFASTVTVTDAHGQEVSVDHACGHDMHMACMTTMATLMAARRDQWDGTLITLFQPAEETGEGAQEMVADGLFTRKLFRRDPPAYAGRHRPDRARRVPGQRITAGSGVRDDLHLPGH
jgi:hippurate hydrolase